MFKLAKSCQYLILQVDLERKRRCGISRENILNNLYCPAAGDKKSGDSKPSDTRLASASAVCIGKSISRIICFVKKRKKDFSMSANFAFVNCRGYDLQK